LFRWPRERIAGNLCGMSNLDAGTVVRRFYEGWNSGSFRGITIPAPARFSVDHVHIYRITEGKLIEHWVVRDDLTMLRQLGAVPNQSSSD